MSTNPHTDDPSHISCTEVLERIYEYLDGELTPEVELQIRDHLACCRRCFPHFRHEQVFLRFLERRSTILKAPPALRRRIMQMLIDEEASRPLE
ncbi:MAG TPA: zf-HC2 domain-containing protein [Gemmatimonadaceae bacterium]|nr:zf-HC2 domain-containing protein [Gemmatimonadaceae bacterium]